jgi:hypothetical protein
MKSSPESAPAVNSQELHLQRIYQEVQGAYDILAATRGAQDKVDTLHTLGVCLEWADAAERIVTPEARLFDQDAQVHIMHFEPLSARSTLRYHRFLRVMLTGMQEDAAVYLDGTWQQFLPAHRRTSELPKVVWGTKDTITAVAKKAGLPRSRYGVWHGATPLLRSW